jgi:hypothetical protein
MSNHKYPSYTAETQAVTENWEVVNTSDYYGAVYVF